MLLSINCQWCRIRCVVWGQHKTPSCWHRHRSLNHLRLGRQSEQEKLIPLGISIFSLVEWDVNFARARAPRAPFHSNHICDERRIDERRRCAALKATRTAAPKSAANECSPLTHQTPKQFDFKIFSIRLGRVCVCVQKRIFVLVVFVFIFVRFVFELRKLFQRRLNCVQRLTRHTVHLIGEASVLVCVRSRLW